MLQVDFPYLVLLISGGHSLLAIVDSVDKFYTLGTTTDNAPGEVLDKVIYNSYYLYSIIQLKTNQFEVNFSFNIL